MRLRELTVSQFRAWSYYSLSFHPSLQYIQGPNGSGKTSLLEAIGFLSNGRSVRTHRDRECVQHDCHSFSVRGEFEDADVDTVSLQYRTDSSSDSRKVVKVDEETLPRLSQLQRLITTIYFSSEDLLTLKKGPSRRRQFMNEVLSRLDDQYLNQLRQYQQALDQRNSLLKKPDPDEVLLESIEETMAKNATTVIRRRSELFPALQPDLVEEHGQLTHSGDVSLSIDYDPDVGEPDSLLDRLQDERSRAEQRGYTTIGPQRDDWMIRENGQSVGKFNSQGELRTLVSR